jgi:glycine oxidase
MAIPDVLVAGGGVVGASVARELATRGYSVLLIDDHRQPGVATTASAGMLAPLVETASDDPMLGLTVRSRDLYHELVPALEEETGIAIGLRTDGIYRVALTDEESQQARASVASLRQSGFAVEWVEPEELPERIPGINPSARGAAVAVEDGALDPGALLRALLASAAVRGVRIRRGERVEEIVMRDGQTHAVRTGRRRGHGTRAGHVVIAAGCWSGRIAGLPRPLSVEPVRGQMVALPWPEGVPPTIAFGPGWYVLERGGEALVGSTMEHVGYDASVTEDATARLAELAGRLYPALAGRSVSRSWAGLRPGTPDGRPLLGRDPEVLNLWYATGHGRNGILLAAVTARLLAALVSGESVETDLTLMDPARFWKD